MIEQHCFGCNWRSLVTLMLTVGFLGVAGMGCHSKKPESARFASVEVRGSSPTQIADRILEVFRDDSYALAQGNTDNFVFEKKASTLNNIAYGNWTETPVWVRVKVVVVPVNDEVTRIECHAYLLRDHGANTEEEIAVSSLRSHPYQKLLNEVALRLSPHRPLDSKAAPAAAPSVSQ